MNWRVVLGVLVVQAVLASATPLRIGAFNLHIYGQSKSSMDSVVSIISQIIRRYDIILLQEIRDSTETVIHDLLALVNSQESVYTYDIVVGPRLGRSFIKEQYAYVYRSETVRILGNYTYNDTRDVFEREPLIVLVKDLTDNPVSDFVLIGIHVRPDRIITQTEINALVPVYEEAIVIYNTTSVIILGDMNADCSYLSNARYDNLTFTTDSRFLWLISKENDTTTTNSVCAYDRFVVTREINNTLVQGSVLIFLFDREYDLNQTQALDVSDHYPIELQLEGNGENTEPQPTEGDRPTDGNNSLPTGNGENTEPQPTEGDGPTDGNNSLPTGNGENTEPQPTGGDRPTNDNNSLLIISVTLLYTAVFVVLY